MDCMKTWQTDPSIFINHFIGEPKAEGQRLVTFNSWPPVSSLPPSPDEMLGNLDF